MFFLPEGRGRMRRRDHSLATLAEDEISKSPTSGLDPYFDDERKDDPTPVRGWTLGQRLVGSGALIVLCLGGFYFLRSWALLLSRVLPDASASASTQSRIEQQNWQKATSTAEVERAIELWLKEPDDHIMNETIRHAKTFVQSGGVTRPPFGLTKGQYSKMSNHSAERLRSVCGVLPNATHPPKIFILPGRFSPQAKMYEFMECFLWHNERFFSRATGGPNGRSLTRIGAGIDDKGLLIRSMAKYEKHHGCQPFRGYPISLDLNNTKTCLAFFRNNSQFAQSNSLWFIKEAKGSTGRHIKLWRRSEVERRARSGAYSCPLGEIVASLEVQKMLKSHDGYTFDNRIYLLLASIDPLIVFFHHGHLRFSVIKAPHRNAKPLTPEDENEHENTAQQLETDKEEDQEKDKRKKAAKEKEQEGAGGGGADDELAAHVTNLYVQQWNHTIGDSSSSFYPASLLASLAGDCHPADGEGGQERDGKERGGSGGGCKALKLNVRNAAMQVLYALRHRFTQMSGFSRTRGFAIIAMDVGYDENLSAHILDVNSGPAGSPPFLDNMTHPVWLLQERSALIRDAMDIVQEVGFRKVVKLMGKLPNATAIPLADSGEWELLYNQDANGVSDSQILEEGQCYAPRFASSRERIAAERRLKR